jgi:N-hydroxyarylamine O-acetyltransferase
MPETTLTAAECARYLRVLDVPHRDPCFDALVELTTAQLTRVLFENVSKLYRFRRSGFRGVPDLSEVLDGIERYHFGGTCYSNNYHLYRLLATLGYDVTLCAADMRRPDVHLTILVRLEGREYLVDAGYGAPFLEPLPRDLNEDYEVAIGSHRHVLKPRDAAGRSRLELYRGGGLAHGYLMKPAPRRIAEFMHVVESSFAPAATFMNALLIVRCFPGRTLVLHNLELVESEGAASRVRRVPDAPHLPEVIEECFGIPGSIAREALAGLSMSQDPWS